MIQLVPQLKVLVACEPVDFRKGIDSLACVCRQQFQLDPFLGTLFVFRNRSGTALKLLVYDGQGAGTASAPKKSPRTWIACNRSGWSPPVRLRLVPRPEPIASKLEAISSQEK